MLFVAWTITNLGIDNLRGGVGTGHLVSALLIPVAGAVGGFVAARRRIARESHDGLGADV